MTGLDSITALQAEIVRLNKIIRALMDRAERTATAYGSDFNLFQTAITLESQVRQRTAELEEARDKTEKIARELRESENRYRLLFDNAPTGIYELDLDGRIIALNRAAIFMYGFKDEKEAILSSFLEMVDTEDQERIGELLEKACGGMLCHYQYKASGVEEKYIRSCFVPIRDKSGLIVKLMGIMEDITERRQNEKQIHRMAFYDTLTQLPNRRLLSDRLQQAMNAGKRTGQYGVLMFMDLDNFKELNDTHGHDMGDLLLIEVAQRLNRCIREMDTIARFGGDEFVAVVSMLGMERDKAIVKAGIVAGKILASLAEPYLLKSRAEEGREMLIEHRCSASIGMVIFKGIDTRQEELFKLADKAMYQAKADGGNRVFLGGRSRLFF